MHWATWQHKGSAPMGITPSGGRPGQPGAEAGLWSPSARVLCRLSRAEQFPAAPLGPKPAAPGGHGKAPADFPRQGQAQGSSPAAGAGSLHRAAGKDGVCLCTHGCCIFLCRELSQPIRPQNLYGNAAFHQERQQGREGRRDLCRSQPPSPIPGSAAEGAHHSPDAPVPPTPAPPQHVPFPPPPAI